MVRKYQKLLNLVNSILDGVLVFLSYCISTYIRFDVMYGNEPALPIAWNARYFLVAGVYALVVMAVYHANHMYGSSRFNSRLSEGESIFRLNLFTTLGLAALLYATRLVDFSRIALMLLYLISSTLMVIKRLALRHVMAKLRTDGLNRKFVLLVGSGHQAQQYQASLQADPGLGMHLIGYLAPQERPALGERLGGYDEIGRVLETRFVDEVVLAIEPEEHELLPGLIAAGEKQGCRLCIVPFYNDYIPSHPTIEVLGNTKLINLRTIPLDDPLNALLKRAEDIVASLLLILVTSPFMLLAAIGTRLSSPGPVIFRQERVGKDKKTFTMYKFRSMRVNAAQDSAWSKNEDPRKTKFGSFLRKTSIDELPQFFNVLKGDMSLIGPRPEIPFHVEHFKEDIPLYMVRHQVRPGITGWAQVNGLRGDTSIEQRVRYDIWYIENWSLGLDIAIIFRTIFGGMINKEKL